MRTLMLRVLPVGLALCAFSFSLVPNALSDDLPDEAKTYLEMASVSDPISNTRDADSELHKRRRIPRVGITPAEPFQVLASVRRWQKHFGNPVICNMIFCHGSCADYDDSCPSFKHSLLENLLEENVGCNLQPRAAEGVGNSREQGKGADACCAERAN